MISWQCHVIHNRWGPYRAVAVLEKSIPDRVIKKHDGKWRCNSNRNNVERDRGVVRESKIQRGNESKV